MSPTSENLTPPIRPAVTSVVSSANRPRIFNDVFTATHERLAAEFQPKSPAIDHWLDPDGGLAMPPEDLLRGPVADELPAIYDRFKSIEPGLDWRRLAAACRQRVRHDASFREQRRAFRWGGTVYGRIGVELSEEFQLHPEQSTSAIIVHHPEAKYFNAN